MVRSTRNVRNQLQGPPNPTPDGVDSTGMFEAFVRCLERASDNPHGHCNCHGAPGQQTGDRLIERFCALYPNKLDGMAEAW